MHSAQSPLKLLSPIDDRARTLLLPREETSRTEARLSSATPDGLVQQFDRRARTSKVLQAQRPFALHALRSRKERSVAQLALTLTSFFATCSSSRVSHFSTSFTTCSRWMSLCGSCLPPGYVCSSLSLLDTAANNSLLP